jgi:hypothetical protein
MAEDDRLAAFSFTSNRGGAKAQRERKGGQEQFDIESERDGQWIRSATVFNTQFVFFVRYPLRSLCVFAPPR